MQKQTHVTLDEHFEKFVDAQIENGRFQSVRETVQAGLKLLEQREAKLEVLRAALIEGENSGEADYSLSALIKELDGE